MIEFKNITKKYGSLTVYENFNLSLEEGKITCILGESGSGKTTLLNMLAGLTPYEGEISQKPACSYIFQQPRLVPSLTVRGNLKLVCKDKNRVEEMLLAVGLSDKAALGRPGAEGFNRPRLFVSVLAHSHGRAVLLARPCVKA